MDDNALNDLYWRDELLQIMYWFRGEGLGEAVTPGELLTFLEADEEQVRRYLERLVEEGYAARLEGALVRYRLTEWGVKEGGRRFADEFAGLTGQAHGECNNSDCSCKTLGPDACTSHTGHRH